MNKTPLVSIGIHNGKLSYIPMVENLLKSILICNRYPNIQIVLTETAGNQEVRDWFSQLDLSDYFCSFTGKETSVKKADGVTVSKKLLFLDYPTDFVWYQCYTDAMKRFFQVADGEYAFTLAEDNQFFIVGDVISDCISLIENKSKNKTVVCFPTLQQYKYGKQNNSFGPIQTLDKIKYFQTNSPKWDPTYIAHKSIYEVLGDFAVSDAIDPHGTINHFNKRSIELGFTRFFLQIPQCVWFSNGSRNKVLSKIIEKNADDPNSTLITPIDKNEAERLFEVSLPRKLQNCPLSTEEVFS